MGLLNNILGNATEISLNELQNELKDLLVENEAIEKAYRIIRDMFVFTNKRLILIDKQGVTGKKVEYHSIPYRSITHFSIETAGHFDLDAELKIWITSAPLPLQKQFTKDSNIYKVQTMLASYVLK